MMSERKEDRIIRIHKNLLPLKIEKRAKHFPGAFGGRVCVCVCVVGGVSGLRGGRKGY